MEIGIEKCVLLIKGKKRNAIERIGLPNWESIRTIGEKESYNYKYMEILEADIIKERVEKNKMDLRTRKRHETKFCYRNLIKEINTRVASLVRYPEVLLKWTREDLRSINHMTIKLMIMQKNLRP